MSSDTPPPVLVGTVSWGVKFHTTRHYLHYHFPGLSTQVHLSCSLAIWCCLRRRVSGTRGHPATSKHPTRRRYTFRGLWLPGKKDQYWKSYFLTGRTRETICGFKALAMIVVSNGCHVKNIYISLLHLPRFCTRGWQGRHPAPLEDTCNPSSTAPSHRVVCFTFLPCTSCRFVGPSPIPFLLGSFGRLIFLTKSVLPVTSLPILVCNVYPSCGSSINAE